MNIRKIGRAEDLTGNIYGRLTAISYEASKWVCKCESGNLVTLCVPCHKLAHQNNFKTGLDEHLAILLKGYVNQMEGNF